MSLMDKFLPSFQFSERHQTMVRCGPGELLDIIQDFRPPKDGFSALAMFVRQLPAKLMHWAAPSRMPQPSPSRWQISFHWHEMVTEKSSLG
jgi:hypothetical protein